MLTAVIRKHNTAESVDNTQFWLNVVEFEIRNAEIRNTSKLEVPIDDFDNPIPLLFSLLFSSRI